MFNATCNTISYYIYCGQLYWWRKSEYRRKPSPFINSYMYIFTPLLTHTCTSFIDCIFTNKFTFSIVLEFLLYIAHILFLLYKKCVLFLLCKNCVLFLLYKNYVLFLLYKNCVLYLLYKNCVLFLLYKNCVLFLLYKNFVLFLLYKNCVLFLLYTGIKQ